MTYAVTQEMPVAELLKNLIPDGKTVTHLPGLYIDKVSLTADTAGGAGGVLSWQNPLKSNALAALVLHIRTATTTTTITADCGTDSTGGSPDNLIDAGVLGFADTVSSFEDQGTNGASFRELDENGGTNDYLMVKGSGSAAGLVGEAYILYFPLDR